MVLGGAPASQWLVSFTKTLNPTRFVRLRSGHAGPRAKNSVRAAAQALFEPPFKHLRASRSPRRSQLVADTPGVEASNEYLTALNMLHPARHYPVARRLRREVHLHIGPTNSGKSYTALQAFKNASSGFYAGPLRMLAREIYDRMENEGVPCNLITGDEVLEKEGARLNSGTVEMMDLSREMDLAVIDEIQMIEDYDRGWAWSRAFLGVRAHVVHLCGDPNSEKIVTELVRQTGDDLKVHRYERLSPLVLQKGLDVGEAGLNKKTAKKSTPSLYKLVQPGDCVVCFSKKQVQNLRDKIVQAHDNKLCCAIVYGSLPPETRAEQARLFNMPRNGVDYLVASDAIGMGLNLGIKRIIFSTLQKFDGERMRELTIPQIKQIAGRAGRYRTADGGEGSEGFVTCVQSKDVPIVRRALAAKSPEIHQAVLMPHSQVMRSAIIGSGSFERGVAFSRTLHAVLNQTLTSETYVMPRQGGATDIAKLFDRVPNLTFEDRLALANAPVPTANETVSAAFKLMCTVIGEGRSENIVQLFPELMSWLSTNTAVTETLEKIHKTITLFLWLSFRFPCNFIDRHGALDLKKLCEAQFNKMLSSHKSLASPGRARTVQMKAIDRGEEAAVALAPFKKRASKTRRQATRRKGKPQVARFL